MEKSPGVAYCLITATGGAGGGGGRQPKLQVKREKGLWGVSVPASPSLLNVCVVVLFPLVGVGAGRGSQ